MFREVPFKVRRESGATNPTTNITAAAPLEITGNNNAPFNTALIRSGRTSLTSASAKTSAFQVFERDVQVNHKTASIPEPDIAASEFAGSFTWVEDNGSRSLTWRVRGQFLELQETSFSSDVEDHILRLKFEANIIPNVCVHADLLSANPALHIFVVTTARFLHHIVIEPKFGSKGVLNPLIQPLYHEFSNRHNYFQLREQRDVQYTVVANATGRGVVIGCANGNIIHACLHGNNNISETVLQKVSKLQRLWSGLVSIGGSGDVDFVNPQVIALEAIQTNNSKNDYIAALCGDGKLRLWSLDSRTCLCTYDIKYYSEHPGVVVESSTYDEKNAQQGYVHTRLSSYGFRNMKRISVSSDEGSFSFYLAMFFSYSTQTKQIASAPTVSQFHVCKVTLDDSESPIDQSPKWSITSDGTKFSEQDNLIDFVVMNGSIWALWGPSQDGASEYSITYGSLLRNTEHQAEGAPWSKVNSLFDELTGTFPKNPVNMSNKLVDMLLWKLFDSGLFSRHAIQKNLAPRLLQGRRSHQLFSDRELREKVLQTIEHKMNQDQQPVANVGEFDEKKYNAWREFWESCVASWYQENAPRGLLVDNLRHTIGAITRNGITVYRPSEPIEILYCNPSAPRTSKQVFTEMLAGYEEIDEMISHRDDVLNLIDCVSFVAQQLGENFLVSFEHALLRLEEPIKAAQPCLDWLLGGVSKEPVSEIQQQKCRRFMPEFTKIFRRIKSPQGAVETLLILLETTPLTATGEGTTSGAFFGALLTKSSAQSVICRTCLQIIQTRFNFARDLVILLFLLEQVRSKVGISFEFRSHLQSLYSHKSVSLLKMYSTLKWLSAQQLDPMLFISSEVQFAALQLSDTPREQPYDFAQLFYSETCKTMRESFATLDELFIKSTSHLFLFIALTLLDSMIYLQETKINALSIANMLLKRGQYRILQYYAQLLTPDLPIMNHYLGLCYLQADQVQTAKDCFLNAAAMLLPTDQNKVEEALLITLFESLDQSGDLIQIDQRLKYNQQYYYYFYCMRRVCPRYPELVLEFSKLSLQESSATILPPLVENGLNLQQIQNEERARLWSEVFNLNLKIEQYHDAYIAITLNPDSQRQKEDLRWFISILCEKGKLALLNELPYVDMTQQVTEMLHQKAKNSDIVAQKPNFYEILYSFHVYRNNYKAAAVVMYEYGQRLGKETHAGGYRFMEKQCMCYLAAINALKMVKSAWIPVYPEKDENKDFASPQKRKRISRSRGSPEEIVDLTSGTKKELAVLTIEDLQKTYLLTKALLQLSQTSSSPITVTGLTPHDTVVLLVEAGIYDTAFSLCDAYKEIDKKVIFEHLTSKCIRLQLQQDTEFNYILEVDVNSLPTDESVTTSAQQVGWRLLEYYLRKYDTAPENNSRYHRLVVDKILSTDRRVRLPKWLTSSLQYENPSSLLQSYIRFELWEDACFLLLQYLKWRQEYTFNAATTTTPTTTTTQRRSVPNRDAFKEGSLIPYTIIDELMTKLDKLPTGGAGAGAIQPVFSFSSGASSQQQQRNFAELKRELTRALAEYFEAIKQHTERTMKHASAASTSIALMMQD